MTDGLRPALEQLACAASVPIAIAVPSERFPEMVESTAYFTISEALANVVKHSRATRADVSVARSNEDLVVQVRDDGVGGANPSVSSGLAGLADRVAAIGGRFTVESPAGCGTTVTAMLPVRDVG